MEDYLVIGLVLLLILGLSIVEQIGPRPEGLLPEKIGDFVLIDKSDRVDPLFEGERYSSHAFYKPAEESELANSVDRLAITIYLFNNNQSCRKAKNMLLSTFEEDSMSEESQADHLKSDIHFDPAQNQAEIFWCENTLLYQISAVGKDEQFDHQAFKQALIQAIKVTR